MKLEEAKTLYQYGEKVAFITVYIPRPPKFIDPWPRGEKANEESTV